MTSTAKTWIKRIDTAWYQLEDLADRQGWRDELDGFEAAQIKAEKHHRDFGRSLLGHAPTRTTTNRTAARLLIQGWILDRFTDTQPEPGITDGEDYRLSRAIAHTVFRSPRFTDDAPRVAAWKASAETLRALDYCEIQNGKWPVIPAATPEPTP